jgi:predicted Zn-dependent protease
VGTLLGVEAAKRYTSEEVASLVTVFEESIDDVMQTLVVNGYSRDQEREADRGAVAMLLKTGYDPGALVNMLKLMKQRLHPGGHDFASTHPDPLDRIRDVQSSITQRIAIPFARQQRYNSVLARI